jgi:hypothetical protein
MIHAFRYTVLLLLLGPFNLHKLGDQFTLVTTGEESLVDLGNLLKLGLDDPELVPQGQKDLKKWLEDGTLTNTDAETVVEAKFVGERTVLEPFLKVLLALGDELGVVEEDESWRR